MKLSLCLFLVSSALAFFLHGVNGADITGETCKHVVGKVVPFHFCVASLRADPRSHTADLHQLGIISMENCKANATYVQSKIQKLLDGQKWNFTMEIRFKSCLEFYSSSITYTDQAISSFNSKQYEDAMTALSAVSHVAGNCQDGFDDVPGLVSPLTKENKIFKYLGAIPLFITSKFS